MCFFTTLSNSTIVPKNSSASGASGGGGGGGGGGGYMTNDISDVAAIVSYANSADNTAPASSDMIEVGVMQYDAETGFFI
jgi:hypothetical protein